ncbi:MAG: ADP-heptose:LPS heptosyltransferase [Planctomycetota bacterium]|jgi:ADP-heptose:LPS heptosyltransferase
MTTHLQGDEQLLVRLPKWLGDCIMAEPALVAIAAYWRSKSSIERLTVVGPAHLLGLWDERFVPGGEGRAHLGGANLVDAADQAAVRSAMARADVALLLTGSFRSAFEAWRARIPRRIGWARDLRGALLTDTMTPMLERGGAPLVNVLAQTTATWMPPGKERLPKLGIVGRFPRYAPRPYGSTCIELVASLGIPVRRTKPQLQANREVTQAVRDRLSAAGIDPAAPFAVLNAGSRPGSAKGWQGWSELAPLLRTQMPVVLICGPGEEASLRDFPSSPAVQGEHHAQLVLDKPPLDLAELTALAAGCDAFVTADAGARHIATAAGAQTHVLFGSTDPRHTADHLQQTYSFAEPQPCGPCHREVCGAPDLLACFRGIAADRIAAGVRATRS